MFNLNLQNFIKNSNLMDFFSLVGSEYSISALLEILKLIVKYKQKLDGNVNLIALSDGLLLDILEVKFLCK